MNYFPLTGGDLAAFVSLTLKVLLYLCMYMHIGISVSIILRIWTSYGTWENLVLHIPVHMVIALFTFQTVYI